jgi:hypothetical protein
MATILSRQSSKSIWLQVFTNCAGFLKIDTRLPGDGAEPQVELLDGSRVHPEIYDWARKFAVDVLKYHGEENVDPGFAVKKILDAPEKLEVCLKLFPIYVRLILRLIVFGRVWIWMPLLLILSIKITATNELLWKAFALNYSIATRMVGRHIKRPHMKKISSTW